MSFMKSISESGNDQLYYKKDKKHHIVFVFFYLFKGKKAKIRLYKHKNREATKKKAFYNSSIERS